MKNLKSNKGITLIALIITIIVMLILVGVTINVALNGGLFDTARAAVRQTEEQAIYDQIVGAIKIASDGNINVKGTYESAKKILESQGKTVTLTSPTELTESTSSATFEVQGKNGTYAYTITTEKIILGAIEQEQSDFIIEVAEFDSTPKYKTKIQVTPQTTDTTFNFTDETEAVKYVAKKEFNNNSITTLEELLVVIVNNADLGVTFDDYDTMVTTLSAQFPDGDFSTPQSSYAFYMGANNEPYTTVQEYAASIYEPTDRKLVINGKEITEGVTWSYGNIATYEIAENGTYKIQLQLDEKIGTKTIEITGIENIGKYVTYDSNSDGSVEDEILFRLLYDEGELGQGHGAQIIVANVSEMNDVNLGYNDTTIDETKVEQIDDDPDVSDIERAFYVHNNSVNILNDKCKAVITEKKGITDGVRSLGSNPREPYEKEEDNNTHMFMKTEIPGYNANENDWFALYDGKAKKGNADEPEDLTKLRTNKILEASSYGEGVALASRFGVEYYANSYGPNIKLYAAKYVVLDYRRLR